MQETSQVFNVLAGAAIAIGSLCLYVGVRRAALKNHEPSPPRLLLSAKGADATHPVTLIVNGTIMLVGGVVAAILL